ncbi:hypothetical protein [Natronorubrum halophilum]|uniref:hypothetical protein n=1 Tax=Natronorubrum halophilum TaxID=1702106 RepID=UPI0010C1A0B3|nr:hypothetical protein [Natronorubrum halophilum]
MASRTNAKSNSHFGRLRERIRSTLFAGEDPPADDAIDHAPVTDPSPTNPDAPGNLFHCSTCGTVYIDSEKRVCSTCDETVEEVRSTLESSVMRS